MEYFSKCPTLSVSDFGGIQLYRSPSETVVRNWFFFAEVAIITSFLWYAPRREKGKSPSSKPFGLLLRRRHSALIKTALTAATLFQGEHNNHVAPPIGVTRNYNSDMRVANCQELYCKRSNINFFFINSNSSLDTLETLTFFKQNIKKFQEFQHNGCFYPLRTIHSYSLRHFFSNTTFCVMV